MLTLSLPTQRDPIARAAVIILLTVAAWAAADSPTGAMVLVGVGLAGATIAVVVEHFQQQAARIAELEVRQREYEIRLAIGNHQRFLILKRDGYRCQLCGKAQVDGAILEIDHKIARARGGTDDPSNLWTLCRPCNGGKSAHQL